MNLRLLVTVFGSVFLASEAARNTASKLVPAREAKSRFAS